MAIKAQVAKLATKLGSTSQMDIRPNVERIDYLTSSVCDLLTTLIQLFHEGVEEEFDQDAFFTILSKAHEDAVELRARVEGLEISIEAKETAPAPFVVYPCT
jgi:hypothetical protein